MWIYVFGSLVRGDFDEYSDIDSIAVVRDEDLATATLPSSILLYSESEARASFQRGDLFAHHLFAESVLVFSRDKTNLFLDIGPPSEYQAGGDQIEHFYEIGSVALHRLENGTSAKIFNLGLVFMAIRDLAMIHSYYSLPSPSYSKMVPYEIDPELPLSREVYLALKNARSASTRGGEVKSLAMPNLSSNEVESILGWMRLIREDVHARIRAKA